MKIAAVRWRRWILTPAVRELGTTHALAELDDGQDEINPMAPEVAVAVAEFPRETRGAI